MRKFFKNISQNKGFTLIELLVVVAIIGFLAAMATQSVGKSMSKARDARRKADVKAIKNAINLYYQENGSLPSPGDVNSGQGANWLGSQLVPKYISKSPMDPINTGNHRYFLDQRWGSTYRIYVALENSDDKDMINSRACAYENGWWCWGASPNPSRVGVGAGWYKVSGY